MTLYAFANTDDDLYMSCTEDDPNISYQVYLDDLKGLQSMQPTVYNAGVDVLYSFGPEFTALDLTWLSASPLVVAILVSGGMFVYGTAGIYDTIIEDGPEAWYNFCTLMTMALESDAIQQLENIWDAIVAGQSFYVSQDLRDAMLEAIQGLHGFTTDSAGNVIDTSISIPADELRVGTVWTEKFNAASDNRKWISISGDLSASGGNLYSASNEWMTRELYLDGEENSWQRLTNKITGSSIKFNYHWSGTTENNMSRFYHCVDDTDGAEFWLFGTAYGNNTSQRTYCAKQGLEWFEFSGTSTVLDGQRFVSAVYDTVTEMWQYINIEGISTWFPLDPFGTTLSNTGKDTTGAGVANPGAGGLSGNPSYNPEFPDTDTKINAPPVSVDLPPVNSDGTTDSSSKVYETTEAGPQQLSKADADTATEELTVQLNTPSGIKDFIRGIPDSFLGLFDWLPVSFTIVLEGVFVSLSSFMLLLAGVKIIDVIWPG